MTISRIARVSAFVLLAALAVSPWVPKLVSADWQNCSQLWSNTTNCTPGNLHVYVLVLPDSQGQVHQPSDFTVAVQGQTLSANSFQGSQSGTTLGVNGQYGVTALPLVGYEPSYSVGCNDSVTQGQDATCVITESATSGYYTAPQPYPYPYAQSNLSCVSQYQSVGLGQTASFTAVGGDQGTFNWATPFNSYQGIGPVLNIAFPNTGLQTVIVSNGSQTATCSINVVANVLANGPANIYQAPPTSLVSSYVPSLPNTGFAPLDRQQIILALLALIAAGSFLAPYVRKAVTIALG